MNSNMNSNMLAQMLVSGMGNNAGTQQTVPGQNTQGASAMGAGNDVLKMLMLKKLMAQQPNQAQQQNAPGMPQQVQQQPALPGILNQSPIPQPAT